MDESGTVGYGRIEIGYDRLRELMRLPPEVEVVMVVDAEARTFEVVVSGPGLPEIPKEGALEVVRPVDLKQAHCDAEMFFTRFEVVGQEMGVI